jgi:hypothetical protein
VTALRIGLPWAVLVTALGAAVGWVLGNGHDLGATLGRMGTGRVLVATSLGVLGVAVTAEVWRCSVMAVAGSVPSRLSHKLFWVSQAGKYAPGAVWPFVVQALGAGRLGLRSREVLTGGSVFLGVHALTGLLLASVALAMNSPNRNLRIAVWGITAVAVLLVGSGAWRQVTRLLRRPAVAPLRRGPLTRAFTWMSVAWFCYAGSTAVLLTSVTDDGALPSLWRGMAASAIGWLVGLVVVFAPAGAGARELAMVWVLGPGVGAEDVMVVVLMTRLILVVADLGLACTGVGTLRALRRAPAGSARPEMSHRDVGDVAEPAIRRRHPAA